MERFSRYLPLIAAALAFPLVAWFGVMVWGFGIAPYDAAGAFAFQFHYAALIVCVAIAVVSAIIEKIYGKALIFAGVVFVLLQGALLYGYRFSGAIGVGEGEAFTRYESVSAGPWAKPVIPPLALTRILKEPKERVVVLLGGAEKELSKGEQVAWKELSIRLEGIYSAPLLILKNAQGLELEGGYIKLTRGIDDDFIQFRGVPHRFYVSLPGTKQGAWKRAAGAWTFTDSGPAETVAEHANDMLNLRIARGKLTLFNGPVRSGEEVKFDGYAVRFEQGALWAQFEVMKQRRYYTFFAGLAMLFAGAALTMLSRSKP